MKSKSFIEYGSMELFLLSFVTLFLLFSVKSKGQCVYCNANSTNGSFSSAIGTHTHANGNFSFVAGENSKANGRSSFSLGQSTNVYDNYGLGIGRYLDVYGSSSLAIGRFLRTLSPESMVIGYGFSESQTLDNNVNRSLMIGFESTKPTLFVGPSNGQNSTGSIGIGNITNPNVKLHLLSDENEAAELRLEHRSSGTAQFARVYMGTHTIRAGNNENMVFTTPNTSRHFVFTNGRVGIGTTSPQQQLHVVGNALVTGNLMANTVTTITNTNLVLATNGTERMRITSTGAVAIGTTDPKGYKLAVKGKMIAEEVVVKMSGSWPDYVFRDDYQLMTVHEVESFIETHGHLPEVPNAQLIAESGISLGALNTVLVKKVEELTLYIIQQQKEIDVLKLKMASIANQ